jgi:hypothetical protein
MIAIYHLMKRREGFEETAGMLWVMVCNAARQHPGQPRSLYMDIEGHTARGEVQNQVGVYDADASEVIHFVRAALGPFLTDTSWGKTEDAPQSEDLPEHIIMTAADGEGMLILTGDNDQPVRHETAPASQQTEPGEIPPGLNRRNQEGTS